MPLARKIPTNGKTKSTDSSIPFATNEWCETAQLKSLGKLKPRGVAVQFEVHTVIVMTAMPYNRIPSIMKKEIFFFVISMSYFATGTECLTNSNMPQCG